MNYVLKRALVALTLVVAAASARAIEKTDTLHEAGTQEFTAADVLNRGMALFKGEAKTLPFKRPIKRVAIGDGALLSSTVVDNSLLLLAEKEGTTSLIVWTDRGKALETIVHVTRQDTDFVAAQVRDRLKDVHGLNVSIQGSDVVLTGAVHDTDMPIVKAAVAKLPNIVDLTRAEDGPGFKRTLHFKVQIVELSKKLREQLGIDWASTVAGPEMRFSGTAVATGAMKSVAPPGGMLIGIASSLTSRINLAVQDGDAYLLAAPELNTVSGGTATFLAGGQIPIPKAGALGTVDVEYRDYGVKLEIMPVVDSQGNISAKLNTEVSQIDPSITVGTYPAFLTRRASSQLSMRAGQTVAISGLINADASNVGSKIPFLGSIPILGKLFGSSDFRNNKSDMVILVTPEVVDPEGAVGAMADLRGRAAEISARYRQAYGNPSPIQDGKTVASSSAETRVDASERAPARPAIAPAGPMSAQPAIAPAAPMSAQPAIAPAERMPARPAIAPAAPVSAQPVIAPTAAAYDLPSPLQRSLSQRLALDDVPGNASGAPGAGPARKRGATVPFGLN
ncbi:type II and III secretion system protein family protein [Burkholderia metallica]|uniref:type II and III secretion system protein family protein n=1 Tax=Burkholderia metallica TaxID=488729 RepID=UPI00157AC852|nr:pilus assembly protein N-terminal domain-containing protein [Burkholderia metallica]